MLSSVNSFGGLSAAELLKLFGANSSSSSASSTSKSNAQSAPPGASASSANNPANAIQAILAQAQIAQATTSGGGSASIATVAAAYAAQTETPGGVSATTVTAEAADAVQMGSSSSLLGASDTMSWHYSSQVDGVSYSGSYSVTSAPLVSTSHATSDSTSNSQTEVANHFQLALTIGNDSLVVGFTVDGLGQVGPLPSDVGGVGVSVGQGNQGELLQIMAGAHGQSVGIDFTVGGLNAAQEQQVAAAFKEATSAPNETRIENVGGTFQYDKNFGPGFSGTISATGAYSLNVSPSPVTSA